MILINLWKKSHSRLVTVINNHPWYRSTGRNSGYPGTWFFFGGVLETKSEHHSTGWLIKPRSLCEEHYSKTRFFGRDTTHYAHRHSIDRLINFSRFGDIEKICISASLGGGFWLSNKGQELQNYLRRNYTHYFLASEEIKKILESAKCPDIPVYTDPQQVNLWLEENGVASVGELHNQSMLLTVK